MFKLIFFVLVISLFTVLFADVITESATMLTVATTSIAGALQLIFRVLAVSFTSMLSFYYLKLALYIGVLFFIVSYIFKWITGHHLESEKDVDEYIETNYLDKKEIKILPMPTRTKDLYSSKQSYDPWHNLKVRYAKNQNKLYESSLRKQKKIKNYEKESINDLRNEFEKWRNSIN